ncbi:hypothetical protein KP509_29G079000 [Ceratopteris richardii]|uniref:Conserved oligomeric Golgi complex subunit 7 n=1 Tax=Ceratopteris richardii TaxID=49495 RepID=A0A8T2R8D5_CERRI|nr:hypothetical protein KP509_29G079000 [Ceratopteris richardii]KAH7292647.1 hypothetical protein KP509_29G079000 [Ceratopteris richardii]
MMVVNLSSFADENFNPKAWVNEACKSRHPEDPIDKHLTDLETKLQLVSENIATSLEEQSSASLLKVPRASREIIRLRDDATSLRSTVSTILSRLKQAEGSCAESVAALARVDVVKQRMEAAYGTLQDAAGLAQLSANVEAVFASGDLARVADTLANMRRCLSVIGEVPDFSNMRQQLEILEDRLEGMVLPKLSDALVQKKVESTQSLYDILVTIGRYSSLEKQYTRVRLKPLRRVWEESDSGKGGLALNKLSIEEKPDDSRQASSLSVGDNNAQISFVDWLPHFYDEVLLYLEQEWKWCSIAFPEKYKSLVPTLLVETMSSISTSFTLRIESSSFDILSGAGPTDDGQKGEKLQHTQLGLLIALHNMTGTFARNIQHLFGSIESEDMVRVLSAIYSPYEGFKERYGDLELSLLSNQVSSLDFRGAVARSVGARGLEVSETVRRMEASIPAVALFLEAAVERCLNFTGGSEVEALLRTLDEVMRLFIGKLQDMLKSLRIICAVDRTVDSTKREGVLDGSVTKKDISVLDMVSDEEEWAIVQGVLQILAVTESLNSRTSVFESTLCATLRRLGERLCLPKLLADINQAATFTGKSVSAAIFLTGGFGASLSFDIAILRLFDKPDKARRLHSLLEQANDTGFHALAHTSGLVASFNDLVNDLVYDVLIAKVRARLNNVALLPIWSAEKEENVFDLPSFSAYASPHVTSMGEYLLTLPQQLEPVMMGGGSGQTMEGGDDNVDDSQLLAAEWMFKVAEGAISLYTDQLRGIQFLSDRGAQQLSADIDYLSKVLSALSMQVPLALATFQACLQVSKEKLADFIKLETNKHLDSATGRLICKMRRVSVD